MKIWYGPSLTPSAIKNCPKPLLIFDFDGTLCDSMHTGIDLFNALAPRFNLPAVGIEDIRQHRLRDTFARLGIRWYTLLRIMRAMKKALREHLPALSPFADTQAMIHDLRRQGFTLAILTSNSQETTNAFLKLYQLEEFAFVAAGASLFGKAKLMKKILAKHGLENHEVIYIGDETRDVEAMREVGVKVVAVSWGWNSYELLASSQPDALVDTHLELTEVLQQARQGVWPAQTPVPSRQR